MDIKEIIDNEIRKFLKDRNITALDMLGHFSCSVMLTLSKLGKEQINNFLEDLFKSDRVQDKNLLKSSVLILSLIELIGDKIEKNSEGTCQK